MAERRAERKNEREREEGRPRRAAKRRNRRERKRRREKRGRSVGYRSVRVLLQRPTGQRITRNSRLDSAEFERAPADLAFLHRFASLCFALGLACLASSLLSSPLLSSPLLSSPLSCGSPLSLLVPTGFTAFSLPSFSFSLCLREALVAGLPDRLPRDRIEILLRADCLNANRRPITTMKRAEISRTTEKILQIQHLGIRTFN